MYRVQKIVKGQWVKVDGGNFCTFGEATDMLRHLREAGFKARVIFA